MKIINKPYDDRNFGIKYRYSSRKFWIVFLLQDVALIENIQLYFTSDKQLEIFSYIYLCFFGLIFLLIGVLFAKKNIYINLKWSFFGLCISMLLLMGEIYCLKHYLHLDAYDMYLFLVPAVFFLFSFAAQIKLPNKKLCKDLRIIGVLIYFIHLLSYYTFINFLNFTNYHFKNVRFVRPEYLYSVILALLISIIIKKLSDKKKFRWLRYLYS